MACTPTTQKAITRASSATAAMYSSYSLPRWSNHTGGSHTWRVTSPVSRSALLSSIVSSLASAKRGFSTRWR